MLKEGRFSSNGMTILFGGRYSLYQTFSLGTLGMNLPDIFAGGGVVSVTRLY
jgi:hypothetical protein